jgi:REP element-mobilizing transposase RayT
MEYLKEAVLRFGLELYAFVLMGNHYHLFVCTPRANLRKAMQYLNGSYAMYFNVRHERSGHLFERRYHAVLIEDRNHYTEVSRYVHLNPVRAGIVERPEQYPWSSYAGYHQSRMPLSWLNYERVLEEFGKGKEARRRYREFVADGTGRKLPAPWREALSGWVLGSPKFVAKVYGMLASSSSEGRWGSRAVLKDAPLNATLDEIASAVCAAYGAAGGLLKDGGRNSRNPRTAFVLVARDRAGLPVKSIASYMNLKSTAPVSNTTRRARQRVASDEEFRKQISRIEKHLKTQTKPKGGGGGQGYRRIAVSRPVPALAVPRQSAHPLQPSRAAPGTVRGQLLRRPSSPPLCVAVFA